MSHTMMRDLRTGLLKAYCRHDLCLSKAGAGFYECEGSDLTYRYLGTHARGHKTRPRESSRTVRIRADTSNHIAVMFYFL